MTVNNRLASRLPLSAPIRCGFFLMSNAALALLFAGSLSAGTPDDLEYWDSHRNDLWEGRVYVKVVHNVFPLTVERDAGIALTGNPELDQVAWEFGVFRLEKAFQMPEPPKDPTIPDLSRYYRAYFPPEFNVVDVVRAYEATSAVEFAEPEPVRYPTYIPNDQRFPQQWHLDKLGFEKAWDVTHGSPEIVIGIVDSGIDMNFDDRLNIHPDLEPNIWINPGEDRNNDGIIDGDDWNGRDDDQNGFVDDFHGWDFTDWDNWPDDPWGAQDGHGTHVAGCASMATDNEEGGAGPGFNCKLMITAHYHPSDPGGGLSNTLNGIEYCVNNGAHVINLSFGHFGRPSGAERDAIRYALSNNVAVFAGAGNDNAEDLRINQEHFYPCAYDSVIGIGASDEQDNHADFGGGHGSNYGDYTDLITPGVRIFSTWPRGSYASHQGTSMASPIAAGTGALMLSVIPNLYHGDLYEWMRRTADDISGRNQDYPGIVWRVNADRLLNSTHPGFVVEDLQVEEVIGNQDGILDQGESLRLNMNLSNMEGYLNATNVVVTLENDDHAVILTRDRVELGNLEAGQTIQLAGANRLRFNVRLGSRPIYATFLLRVTSDEGWVHTEELVYTIGHPYYLFVDDDNGSIFERYIEEDFDQRPTVHDTWTIADQGLPSQERLNGYSFMIWLTGNQRDALSEEKRSLINGFLAGGRTLILSGQYIGDDHGDEEWYQGMLHSSHLSDNTRQIQLSGVPDHQLTDGVELWIIGGDGAGNGGASPSSMTPLDDAEPIVYYGLPDNQTEVAGIYYHPGSYHLIYLGFALESISGAQSSTTRHEFTMGIFDPLFALGAPDVKPATPTEYRLSAPWPNPFNATANISVSLPRATELTLEVVDINGRAVEVLTDGKAYPAGMHRFNWNAAGQPAGIYLVRLISSDWTATEKLVLTR